MKTQKLILTGALALALASPVMAQKADDAGTTRGTGGITDGVASFSLTGFGTDSTGADFTHGGVNGDQLFEYGWYYRIDGDGSETSFNAPTTSDYTGNLATLTWTGLGGGDFDAVETIQLLDTGADSATINSYMTITNTSGGSLTLNIFSYSDLDVDGTFAGDTAVLSNSPDLTTVSDSGTDVEYRALNNDQFQTQTFGDLDTALSDGSITDLDGSGLPFGPADWTGAYQWTDVVIPNGGTLNVGISYGLNDTAPVPSAPPAVGGEESIARFRVAKVFDDGNTGSVDVAISCNTGIPLSQESTVEPNDPVTFVVTDFNDGELDCTITETAVTGYTASYNNGDTTSATSCSYTGILFEQNSDCTITNSLNEVTVDVTKVWIDENPQFNPVNYAEAEWSCTNVPFCQDDGLGGCDSGFLTFVGSGSPSTGSDSFTVFPAWDGSTTCEVDEVFLPDGGVEIDDSDCSSISVAPGVGGSCTITNTRIYEGIPTLSQYGLALMALLMLGVGFVAFRRVG